MNLAKDKSNDHWLGTVLSLDSVKWSYVLLTLGVHLPIGYAHLYYFKPELFLKIEFLKLTILAVGISFGNLATATIILISLHGVFKTIDSDRDNITIDNAPRLYFGVAMIAYLTGLIPILFDGIAYEFSGYKNVVLYYILCIDILSIPGFIVKIRNHRNNQKDDYQGEEDLLSFRITSKKDDTKISIKDIKKYLQNSKEIDSWDYWEVHSEHIIGISKNGSKTKFFYDEEQIVSEPFLAADK